MTSLSQRMTTTMIKGTIKKNRREKTIDKAMIPTCHLCFALPEWDRGLCIPFASECPAHVCMTEVCRSGLKEVLDRLCILAPTRSPHQRLLGIPFISNTGNT